jgi:putative ferrous iron transport protein C
MILADVKNFIQERQIVSMMDLIVHFNSDPETLREMLEFWIRKGTIEKVQTCDTSACNKCQHCNVQLQATEFYKWIDQENQD